MNYKDRAFCVHADRCANDECFRWVDFDVETEGLPIALMDFRKPGCGYVKSNRPEDEVIYDTRQSD